MPKLSNWESHIEHQDSDFPDYYKFFADPEKMAFTDDPDEYEDIDIDEIVEFYARTGPADAAYMQEVHEKWAPSKI